MMINTITIKKNKRNLLLDRLIKLILPHQLKRLKNDRLNMK